MYTAYAIASMINDQLSAAGRTDLHIKPQMMYNYAKNGLIVKGLKGLPADGYSQDQADAFVSKFVTNRIAKGSQSRPATNAPLTVDQIDAQVQALLNMKSDLQGTQNA